MSGRRTVVAAFVLLLIGIGAWRTIRVTSLPAETSASADARAPSAAASGPSSTRDSPPSARPPGVAPRPPERSTLADALNSPSTDIHADLRVVSAVIDTFRSNFLQAGNPVGNNADITNVLTGRNPLRLALVPADHRAINPDGELCDRWGTPFFFHAESATRMEIRSAGPDKKMWTTDDVVLGP